MNNFLLFTPHHIKPAVQLDNLLRKVFLHSPSFTSSLLLPYEERIEEVLRLSTQNCIGRFVFRHPSLQKRGNHEEDEQDPK